MKLADYLAEKQLTVAEFARRIGTTRQAVGHYLAGTRFPRPEQMRRISIATEGAVTANDFMQSAVTLKAAS